MTRARDLADLLATAVESADASIVEVVALTQAEYDALTSVATTLYVVTD
jgi:hypothetical protein